MNKLRFKSKSELGTLENVENTSKCHYQKMAQKVIISWKMTK